MSHAGTHQINRGLRIAAFTTLSLSLVLAAAAFRLPSIAVLAGVCVLALAILLPPALPWISAQLRKIDPFSPLVGFPLAYVLWFVAGSLTLVEAPPGFALGAFDPIPAWMFGLYAWGLVGYVCGIFAAHLLPATEATPSQRNLDVLKMRQLLRLSLLVTLVCWVYLAIAFGITILHPETANADRLAHRGIAFQIFQQLGWTVFVLFPILTWARGGKNKYDWISVVAIPTLLGLLLVSLGVGRSNVFPPLLTLLIARSYFKKQPLLKLAAWGAIAFAAFSILGYFRGALSENSALRETSLLADLGVPTPVVPLVDMSLYVRFTVATLRDLTQIVPSSFPYQHGAMTLLPLTAFLPGHHDTSDMVFKVMLDRNFEGAGTTATLLAPLYVDFGWTGVFFGMGMYGVILSWTYRRMKAQPTAARIAYYAWWLQCTFFGIYNDGYPFVSTFLIPLFWAILFALSKPKPALAKIVTAQVAPG